MQGMEGKVNKTKLIINILRQVGENIASGNKNRILLSED